MPRTARKAGDGPRRLTKTEIAILAYVGEHEGERCSKSAIAASLGRNVKTIDRLVAALRADGLLIVEPHWAKSGGQLANAYRLARAPAQE